MEAVSWRRGRPPNRLTTGNAVPCQQCDDFGGDFRIDRPDILRKIIQAVALGVEQGRLAIDAGDLEWNDHVACDLHCSACGQRFEFV